MKLLVGTPCYGGNVQVNYFHSMMRLGPALGERGVAFELKTLAQESLVSRARNVIAAEFIGRADCTHLLFIDADIGFEPSTVLRLLDFDKPLVAAAYPMKGYDWEKIAATGRKEAGLRFAVNLQDEDRGAKAIPVVDGFARVSKASTGMMLIRRDVFEKMQAAFPDLKYLNYVAGYDTPAARGNFWAFFDTMLHPASNRYLSEDFTFCWRWTEGCGGEVWLDVASRLSHFGHAPYEGSLLETASQRQE